MLVHLHIYPDGVLDMLQGIVKDAGPNSMDIHPVVPSWRSCQWRSLG